MALILRRSISGIFANGDSNLNILSIQPNDIIIFSVFRNNTSTTTVSGATKFADITSGGTMRMSSWYKISTSTSFSTTITNKTHYVYAVYYDNGVDGGTWSLEDSGTSAVTGTTTNTTATVTAPSGTSVLWTGFGNDDDESVNTPPSDMTLAEFAEGGLFTAGAHATYYKLLDIGTPADYSKTITWNGTSEELASNIGVFLFTPTAVGINKQIQIGNAWKEEVLEKIQIGNAWKDIVGEQINIGDAWKTIF